MSITTKNCFQNNIIKTTTEQNTQNKMESIKEMSCLQSKEKTIHLQPKWNVELGKQNLEAVLPFLSIVRLLIF